MLREARKGKHSTASMSQCRLIARQRKVSPRVEREEAATTKKSKHCTPAVLLEIVPHAAEFGKMSIRSHSRNGESRPARPDSTPGFLCNTAYQTLELHFLRRFNSRRKR